MNNSLFEDINESASYIREKLPSIPDHAMVLGTGMGGLTEHIEIVKEISYRFIPHVVPTTVESHIGKLILARWQNKEILILSGRLHYYEGYSPVQVTYPIRILQALGVKRLWLTNASGTVNSNLHAGDIVFIQDHINFHPENPLRGIYDQRLGVRFPDMSQIYTRSELDLARQACKEIGYEFHQAVYFGLQGPSLETPAEYRMIKLLGADIVGMSTVPEAIVAHHSNMTILAASIVSNDTPENGADKITTIDSVLQTIRESSHKLFAVLDRIMQFETN